MKETLTDDYKPQYLVTNALRTMFSLGAQKIT
jgi:hypothetical protein